MSQAVEFDVKEIILTSNDFTQRLVKEVAAVIGSDYSKFSGLREASAELESRPDRGPEELLRLGICYYLQGRHFQAKEVLAQVNDSALAKFYLGRSQLAMEDYDGAIESFKAGAAAGFDSDACAVAQAEALRQQGKSEESLQVLDGLSGAVEQTAEYLYQRGATVAAIGGNPNEVAALFERAVNLESRHPGALTGLAMENDRRGNDQEALKYYERAVSVFPPHVGTLMNLGILYEDLGEFERAGNTYRRILEVFPNHQRARLFLKDTLASGDMYYDEDAERRRDRLSQVLSTPVSDFELSVRSRNCLEKMGIGTLGDLVRSTEHELLASKNFGETSLLEIREMLTSRGLRLGQLAEERKEVEPTWEPEALSPDEQALYERPIADLNLSVRARKCMVRLGITTIGELLRRTGDDLLECKNFGVTSLNEVREKLTIQNLKLRGD